MSAEDVQLVRSAYEAWGQEGPSGGPRAMAPYFHDDVEVHDPPDLPDAGVQRGIEEAVGTWEERRKLLDIKIEPRELIDAGDGQVVVFIRVYVQGSGSGVLFDETHGHVIRLRDGKIAETRIFRDRATALEAAGLPPEAKGEA
jgi:ketosteroid isomerase-like protein